MGMGGQKRYPWLGVLRQCYGPGKYRLAGVMLLSGLTICLETVSPLVTKAIFDRALPAGDISLLLYLSVGWALCLSSAAVLTFACSYTITKVDSRAVACLRTMVFRAFLVEFSRSGETERTQGERLSRIMRDPEAFIGEAGARPVLSAAAMVATLVIVCSLTFYLDWQLALVAVPSAALAMLTHARTPRAVRDSSHALSSIRAEVAGTVDNLVAAWRIIVRSAKVSKEAETARGEFDRLASSEVGAQKQKYVASLRTSLVLQGAPILLVVFAAYRMMHGAMSIGTLLAFFSYVAMIDSSLAGLITNVLKLWSGYGQARDCIKMVVDTSVDVESPALAGRDGALPREGVRALVITGLALKAGEHVVTAERIEFARAGTYLFRGESGAGKTVFLEFLSGIRRCAGGSIAVNGAAVDVDGFMGMARQFGYIGKDEILLNRSVLENVEYAVPPGGAGEWHAWREKLRMRFSDRDSVRGLSAGEKQRVSFVRELLKRPAVFIVDEGLDSLERELGDDALRLLRDSLGEAIIVICTHNWRQQLPIDETLTISNGRIVQHHDHGAGASARSRAGEGN